VLRFCSQASSSRTPSITLTTSVMTAIVKESSCCMDEPGDADLGVTSFYGNTGSGPVTADPDCALRFLHS
jgi:hypothetical protein